MEKEVLIRFFKNTISISQQKAEEIGNFFTPKEIPRNDFQLRQGRVANEYLFLEEGFMRAFAFNTEGGEITTNFYSPNQVVFEVSSFFNRAVSKENIQALTDCKGYFLTYQKLNDLFHAVPEFREFGRAILVKGFIALKSRTLSMITESAEERYAGLLKANPEIFKNAPLKYIASYLGITDTSLSRIRKEYSKK
jgi:CRP-like cAMP-binding protein